MKKNNYFIRLLVIVLAIVLMSDELYSKFENHFNKSENNNRREIISKRTLNSKTYYNFNDHTLTTEISSDYLHYPDRTGRLREIDPQIIQSKDGTHYVVNKGLYKAEFGFNIDSNKWPVRFKMNDGTSFTSKLVMLAYFNHSSRRLVPLNNIKGVMGKVKDNKIFYEDVFNNIDVEYVYSSIKLKQNIYLNQEARETLPDPEVYGLNFNTTSLVFLTVFDVPDTLYAYAGDKLISSKRGLEIKLNHEGRDRIVFCNSKGMTKFLLLKDIAYLQVDSVSNNNTEIIKQEMWKQFYENAGMNMMMTGIDLQWLFMQPEGTIILDPTVSLSPPVGDNWIDSQDTTENNGASDYLNIGRLDSLGKARSLLKFDLSSIPSNADINSAVIDLHFYYCWGNSVSRTIKCHQLLKNWNESEATWLRATTSVDWNTPGVGIDGVDAKATAEDSLVWIDECPVWKHYDITALTEKWVSGTDSNYGVIFWATNEGEYTNGDGKLSYSSEYSTDSSKRPRMIITYNVNSLSAEYEYDVLGRAINTNYSNGVTESNTYDPYRGWLLRKEYKKGSESLFYFDTRKTGAQYPDGYDETGNMTHAGYKHKEDSGEKEMDYTYDKHSRLKTFTFDDSTYDYSYDDNGNIRKFRDQDFTYTYGNNQLSSDGTRSFQYDDAGRMNKINGTIDIEYDIFNNMIDYDGHTYTYDAENQRLRKTESGVSKYYIANNNQVLAEYDKNDLLEAEYFHANGRLLACYHPDDEFSIFYTDHLGSTRRLDDYNSSQNNMRRDYFPYGEATLVSGSDTVGYQFTGKELDKATDLYYFGFRYYDARIGRWLVVDPAGQYWSPYVYCGNNPIRVVDKDGLYGADVHYDLTYYMARRVMGVSNEEAEVIASANLGVDNNFWTRSFNPVTLFGGSLHFKSRASMNRINELLTNSAALSNEEFGKSLHAFSDVRFAHEGFNSIGGRGLLGHFFIGKNPDYACINKVSKILRAKTIRMIIALYGIMKNRNNSKANIYTLNEVWEEVQNFVANNDKEGFTNIQTLVGGQSREKKSDEEDDDDDSLIKRKDREYYYYLQNGGMP
jgi:RHS repeat-associated protein